MAIFLILLALVAAVVLPLGNNQQTKDEFCKLEYIECQAKVSHNDRNV